MKPSWLDCLRDETALRLEAGAESADVQHELIESAAGLSEDERAGLWLFAWAHRPGGACQLGDLRGLVAG